VIVIKAGLLVFLDGTKQFKLNSGILNFGSSQIKIIVTQGCNSHNYGKR
jgi:hypothetical protein